MGGAGCLYLPATTAVHHLPACVHYRLWEGAVTYLEVRYYLPLFWGHRVFWVLPAGRRTVHHLGDTACTVTCHAMHLPLRSWVQLPACFLRWTLFIDATILLFVRCSIHLEVHFYTF